MNMQLSRENDTRIPSLCFSRETACPVVLATNTRMVCAAGIYPPRNILVDGDDLRIHQHASLVGGHRAEVVSDDERRRQPVAPMPP